MGTPNPAYNVMSPLNNHWAYDRWPSGAPYDWSPAGRGDGEWDNLDFHLDLGSGRLKKARIGLDRSVIPEVDISMDLETFQPLGEVPGSNGTGLPFLSDSIKSIVSHHCLEHISSNFLALMDECYRVLEPEGIFRIIVPLFPSYSAVADPDHKRYFLEKTFNNFCGPPDSPFWSDSFAEAYTKCRFEMVDEDITARSLDASTWWTPADTREMRVTLRKWTR